MEAGQSTLRAVAAPRTFGDRLFLSAALVCILVVFLGFMRTYYLGSAFPDVAKPLPLLSHVHGAIMTLWFILFGVQTSLVPAGRADLHQRLGVLGVVLIALIIPIGLLTGTASAARGFTPPSGPPPLIFYAIPVFDIVCFAILAGLGLSMRRRSDYHKRWMTVACFSLLGAAIARIHIALTGTTNPLVFYGVTDLLILIFVWIDTIRNKRLHPAFLWGTVIVIVSQPARMAIAMTPPWMAFAKWATGLVSG